MKKSKLLVLGLIGLLLAGGLVLASCRAGCEGAGMCEVKNGEGSWCSNIYRSSSGYIGCAASKAVGTKGSGKCDC